MTTPKQRAANKFNSLKSTGPKSIGGKLRSSINATKHQLSLPIDPNIYDGEIQNVSILIRGECANDVQANELAKLIVNFERNEAFLMSYNDDEEQAEIRAWILDPHRLLLASLVQAHKNKERVGVTFTTPNKKLTDKERAEEIKFVEGVLRLQDNVLLGKVKGAKLKETMSLRYQKRAINQLIKGVRTIASNGNL